MASCSSSRSRHVARRSWPERRFGEARAWVVTSYEKVESEGEPHERIRPSKIESNTGSYGLGHRHRRLPVRESAYGSSGRPSRPERRESKQGATAAQGSVARRSDDGEDGGGRRRNRRLDVQPDGSTGCARVEDRRRPRDARLALSTRSVYRADRCMGAAPPDGGLFRERTREDETWAVECDGGRSMPNVRGPSCRSGRVNHDVRRRLERSRLRPEVGGRPSHYRHDRRQAADPQHRHQYRVPGLVVRRPGGCRARHFAG